MTHTSIDNILSIIESGASLLGSIISEIPNGYETVEDRRAKIAQIKDRASRAIMSIDNSLDSLARDEQSRLDLEVPRGK